MWRRVSKPRVSIRVLMGLVFLFAIAYTPVLLLIEPYRKEWLGEQRAIAEIRARGHHVGFTTVKVGPQWLQKLSWGHRHYFERVRNLYFVSGGWEDYLDRRSAFHHVGMVFQD